MSSEVEIPRRGPRVFVSYSFSNARVTEFRNALERQGFRPTLVDASTLLGATSLAGAISTLIQDTDYVIQLVDGAALKSAWVQRELELAVEHKVPVVPVLESGIEPSGRFADLPCVLGLDADHVVNRLLEDYVCLDFDPAYPAHFESQAAIQFMKVDKLALSIWPRRSHSEQLTLSKTFSSM